MESEIKKNSLNHSDEINRIALKFKDELFLPSTISYYVPLKEAKEMIIQKIEEILSEKKNILYFNNIELDFISNVEGCTIELNIPHRDICDILKIENDTEDFNLTSELIKKTFNVSLPMKAFCELVGNNPYMYLQIILERVIK